MNYLLIVASACYLESVLERVLSELITDLPKPAHPTDQAARQLLLEQVQSAGARKKANELFAILTGQPMAKLSRVVPDGPGLDVLWDLRNMLAHGNPIRAVVKIPKDEESKWLTEYQGAYKKAHDYLLAQKLLANPVDPMACDWFFLTDAVADHFWSLAYRVVVSMGESLPDRMKEVVRQAVYRPDQMISANNPS
jgi:hypothetical protein